MASSGTSSPPAGPARDNSPASIGRYKVIARLGKGGMAEVLLAMEHDRVRDFKRLVVVKRVIPMLEEEDPLFVQMFLDEARLGARLNHANIVQTYDVGEDHGSPYLSMEFLDGQSLHAVQNRAANLGVLVPFEVVLRIMCDVLEGLHFAHELKDFNGQPLGVIHRDVTPSNIFVSYEGVTKLLDFGIAKSATQREKTRAGVFKGKMAYMAPEQLRDTVLTRAVDVWAMATVIWETLAEERLFRGKNDFETVQNVMTREVPRLSLRRPDVPAALDDILAAALERDPERRIQTGEELKLKLEELAFGMRRTLRRSDVAKVMKDLFGEAQQVNQQLIRNFLEAAPAAAGAYLTHQPSGALEFRPLDAPAAGATGSAGSAREAPRGAARGAGDAGEGSMPLDDRTVVDNRPAFADPDDAAPPGGRAPAPVRPGGTVQVVTDRPREELAPRPLWHWAALGFAVLSTSLAFYLLLK